MWVNRWPSTSFPITLRPQTRLTTGHHCDNLSGVVVLFVNFERLFKVFKIALFYCFVVNNKCIAATNGFKLCSLISVNTHMRSKSVVKIQQS